MDEHLSCEWSLRRPVGVGGQVDTVTVYYCWGRDCPWQPDPERRMDPDNQAQEHTKQAGHPTSTVTRPA